MLTRIVIWWSVMTALTGWAGGFTSLLLIRLVFGIGEALAVSPACRAPSPVGCRRANTDGVWAGGDYRRSRGRRYPATRRRLVAANPLAKHVPDFGLVGVAWAIAWYAWFRDDPQQHLGVNAAELKQIGARPPMRHPRVPWRALLTNRTVWMLCWTYFGVIYGWTSS